MGEQDHLRLTLAMTAAALLVVAMADRREDTVIRFTGDWAPLGAHSVREILSRANAALGPATTPANIDSLPVQAGGRA